jgi:hypothetical protein
MNNTDKFHSLFVKLPQQQPSESFRATLMARVHAEAKRKEHRASVLAWAGLTFAVLLILGIGAYALVYMDITMPHITMPQLSLDAETAVSFKLYTFLAVLVGILLLGDHALRKHFKKH